MRRTDCERLKLREGFEVEDEDENTISLVCNGANYGLYGDRKKWAEAGAVFEGYHSEGGGYPPAKFASDGSGTMADVPALKSEPAIRLDRDGFFFFRNPRTADLEAACDYPKILNRTIELLEPKENQK
jgi:hypothetical protein